MARVEDEENDTEGEKIGILTRVGLMSNNFRCYVEACPSDYTPIFARVISSFQTARSFKTLNFDVIHFVKKEVFRCKVTMRETLGMDVIDTHKHLLEKVFAKWLIKGT